MKGQKAENQLISLLPTEKLKDTFHETIESYMEKERGKGKHKGKTLSKDEWEHLLVRKLLRQTNPNSEYDVLLFQKETSTVYHFESKAVGIKNMDDKSKELFTKEYRKAIFQLEKGKAWLEHIMKILNMNPWNYVGYAAFPNIDNRTLEKMGLSKEQEKIKILTKNEIEDPECHVWNEILRKTTNSPADGISYERLIALLVGSYYVTTRDKLEVMPRATYEDFHQSIIW